jgi:DNA-binding response OmpR family regulator
LVLRIGFEKGALLPAHSRVVLIVDDDADSREMYSIALSVMGFQPCAVGNAEDAFTCACDMHPDAIVADVALPGSSGLDLVRRLRADVRTKEAGIIMLSGYAASAAHQRTNEAGWDRYLVKPCLPDALALEIEDVLSGRDHARQISVDRAS